MYKYAPYSFSKIDLFNKCPYAWRLRYLENVKPEEQESFRVGRLVHEVIEQYLTELIRLGEQTNHSVLEKIVGKLDPDVQEKVLPFVPAIRDIVIPPGIKPYVELKIAVDNNFKPCKYEDESAFLRGRIDYSYIIDDTLVIIDWKTDNAPSPEKIEKDLQTRFYALLLGEVFPEASRFVIELSYLKYQKAYKLEIERDELEKVKEFFLKCIEKIETEKEFKPTPGDWCSVCGYLSVCPVAKSVVPAEKSVLELPERITTHEEALKLAGALKVVDQIRARIQELLKDWVAEHGPIQLSGEVLDFHKSETVKWETADQKAALASLLVREGVSKEEIWDLFSTSKTAVCSFLKRHNLKHLLEEALATGEKSVYERFCFRKKGGERI